VQIIDRKYRLFGVINLIDLLVVIALVVGGLVVWRLLWGGSTTSVPDAKLQNVEYTVLCSLVRNYSEGQIKVGDPVSTKTSGKSIGTIVSVRSAPTPGDVLNPTTGKVQPYDSTFWTDVYIRVKAKGNPTSTGVSIADTQIRNNGVIPVVTPTFQCDTGIATDLKIGGE
jgi:hypothetical protein